MTELCLNALDSPQKQMAQSKEFCSVSGNVVRKKSYYNATQFLSCSAIFGRQFCNLYWMGLRERGRGRGGREEGKSLTERY